VSLADTSPAFTPVTLITGFLFVAGLAGFAFGIDAVNVPATKRIRSKA
jgi:hypothetical protein